MLCTAMMDEEYVENHGNDDTVLWMLLSAYGRHYPTTFDAFVKVEKKKYLVTELENSGHTGDKDDNGNETQSGDATRSSEENALSADENGSQQD